MIGVYFSGTGNTKYALSILMEKLDCKKVLSIEDDIIEEIKKEEIIFFAYPIQFSNIPFIVRKYIIENKEIWKGKKIFCLATMGLFSGDGAGCSARLFKKYKAKILGGLHLRMPDAVADVKTLIRPMEENKKIISNSISKIEGAANGIKNGKYPKVGINIFYHIAGLFGQRLWFKGKAKKGMNKLKINDKCVNCQLCINNCPTHNLDIKDGKVVALGKCTMCYRCISHCPNKAITLLGKEVIEQISIEKFTE